MRLPSDTPDRITGQAVTRCGALPRFAPDLPCGVQLSLSPATMNLIREIRPAGRRRRRRPGAATRYEPGIPLSSTILSHGGVARKRDSGQTRGNDSASHGYSHPRDGWVVVDRHKDTTTRGPLLTFTPVRGRLSPHTVIRHDAGRRGGSEAVTIAYRRLRYVVTKNVTEVLSSALAPVSRSPPVGAGKSPHDETAAALRSGHTRALPTTHALHPPTAP